MTTPTIDQYVTVDKYHAPQWLGNRAARRFHVMAKPAGSACNLDCTCSFYLSKQALRDGPGGGHMDDEVLERFVRDYISCGHYVCPDYWLGNDKERSLGDMVFSPTHVRFAYAKSETLPAYCKRCEFSRDCWGECPKNRLLRTPDGERGLNYLCPGLKRFLAHAVPTAQKLAAQLRAGSASPQPRM